MTSEELKRILEEVPEHANFMPDFFMKIPSLTGELVLALLNKLGETPNVKFLEVGTFHGATAAAASYGHKSPDRRFITIDNFSQALEFTRPLVDEEKVTISQVKDVVLNLQSLCGFEFIEGDCFSEKVIAQVPNDINVYFYDGPHTEEDQVEAIAYYADKLVEDALIIIDDWNYPWVPTGTHLGLKEANLKVKHFFQCEAWSQPELGEYSRNGWWNGLGMFIVGKG